jgi:murein endopeptidase
MGILHRFVILSLAVFAAAGGLTLAAAADQKPREDLPMQVASEIERLRQSKRPSVSQGLLTKGTLEHPAELAAPEGVGYYLAHPDRGMNFGNDRLVFGLMSLGAHLRQQLGDHPDHRLRIHDLSSNTGGKQERHINHQMGLDVDLAFYATDAKGALIPSTWASYGADGKSIDGRRLFDARRNWVVVAGIINNEHFGEIRAILISNALKERLLTYAHQQRMDLPSQSETERAKLASLIKKAEALMSQPTSSPHDNHFHLSLSHAGKP